ncbi:hypothetical protein ACW9H7_06105 [Pseudomonas yamanorum]
MATFHKIRCCYVTIESIHGTEKHLVPSRDNAEALAYFAHCKEHAKVKAHGNFQIEPIPHDNATRFDLLHEEKYHYYKPGTPGYDYLASEFRAIKRAYEENQKKYFDS